VSGKRARSARPTSRRKSETAKKRRSAVPAPAVAEVDGAEVMARHRLFVQAYLQTKPLNAAKAYRETYDCSRASAETNGPRLLRNARVKAYYESLLRMREMQNLLNIDRIEQELACAAYFDPADLLDPVTGATLPMHEVPEHARRALAGFEEEALFEEVATGETGPRGGVIKARVQVGVVRKFKWADKTAAQRLAFQRRGALVEKHEDVTPRQADPTDEELEQLAHFVHTVRGKRDAR
jgi:phage terminase small subunit